MGMSDTVRAKSPLPDGSAVDEPQPRSLHGVPDTDTPTRAGRLLLADGADAAFHGVLRLDGLDATGALRFDEATHTVGQLLQLVPVLVPLADARFDSVGLLRQEPTA